MPYNYEPSDKFGYKDTLPENHPEKIIKGVEFDEEFNKIETAINTLEDAALGEGQFVDAPDDGQLYGRQSKSWSVVPDASGIEEAPIDGEQYARQDGAWSVVEAANDAGAGLVISENEPADKITGMQWLEADTGIVWIWDDGKWLQFPAGSSGGGEIEWNDVLGKPLTFPPSAHGHEISEVNGLQDALDAAGGMPAWNDITGKPTEFPPSAHDQGWDTITGKPTEFPPEDHTHNQYALASDVSTNAANIAANTAAIADKLDADKIWTGTEAEYNALTPDADTLYFIV